MHSREDEPPSSNPLPKLLANHAYVFTGQIYPFLPVYTLWIGLPRWRERACGSPCVAAGSLAGCCGDAHAQARSGRGSGAEDAGECEAQGLEVMPVAALARSARAWLGNIIPYRFLRLPDAPAPAWDALQGIAELAEVWHGHLVLKVVEVCMGSGDFPFVSVMFQPLSGWTHK